MTYTNNKLTRRSELAAALTLSAFVASSGGCDSGTMNGSAANYDKGDAQVAPAPSEDSGIGDTLPPIMSSRSEAPVNLMPIADMDMESSSDELESKGFVLKSAQSAAEIFRWTTNETDVFMKPVSTHICFLTRVSGNLGGSSLIALHRSDHGITESNGGVWWSVNDNGPTWRLGGAQWESNSLTGEATCVPKSAFRMDSGVSMRLSVEKYGSLHMNWPGCSETLWTTLWSASYLSFLSGVRGEFEGTGEAVEIVEGDSGTGTASRLRVATQQCGATEALAFSCGASSGFTYRAYRDGLFGTPLPSLYTTSGTKTVRLQKTKDAVCFLEKITGSFDGAGERVRIYPQMQGTTEWWMLEATANGGTAGTKVNCVLYNQKSGNAPI